MKPSKKSIGRAAVIATMLCFLTTSALAISNFSGRVEFKQITSIEGLTNNTVNDITQDHEGFIWFATNEGLNKFNGQSIKTYYNMGSLSDVPNNFVKRLLSTTRGELFIGTQSGACVYLRKNDRFEQLFSNNFHLGDVSRMIELTTGEVLISSTRGLFIINHNFDINKISDNYYRYLIEHKQGVFWAAAYNEIHLLTTNGDIIKRYRSIKSNKGLLDLSSENIQCFHKHSSSRLWVGTIRNGLAYYDEEADEFISYEFNGGGLKLDDSFIRVINEDPYGNLWIGTEEGLYIYDVEEKRYDHFGQTFNPVYQGLNNKSIYSIYRSNDNTMWVGTYFGGVNYTSLSLMGFNNLYADGGIKSLSGNAVSEMLETSNGELWISTEDNGVTIYNRSAKSFKYIKHSKEDPESIASNNVHALAKDEHDNIWIGTFMGGLNKFNARTKKIERIELQEIDPDPIQYVFSIEIDSKQRIWVGAISGLYMRPASNKKFTPYQPQIFSNNFVYHINQDNDGNIWVCTYHNGIYRIDENSTVTQYNPQNEQNILSNTIIYSFTDTDNYTWFGTLEGGLLKYNPIDKKFTNYTMEDGLPNNTVYAITQDFTGRIWFSTNKGLVSFHPKKLDFTNYTQYDGLVGNQFNYKSCYRTADGMLFFGAVNGLTYFNPANLKIEHEPISLHFTDFKLFNKSLTIGENAILQSHINYQDEIVLKYHYNVFSIDYVGINYHLSGSTVYAYYLQGFESDWNVVGNRRSATYTNLSPGDYIFRVRVVNPNPNSTIIERTIRIKVLPPFWLSHWGFITYFVIVVLCILLYIRYITLRNREKLKIQLVKLEKEKTDLISKQRLNFFTYISHEFKTPLTIVIAAIDQLLEFKDLFPQMKDYGFLIRKSAHRLLFLINQLMEFRKIENDHLTLNLNKGDIVNFTKSTFELFMPIFEQKKITGKFTTDIDSHIAYFDADKIEKIVTNLLINAVNSFRNNGIIWIDLKIIESTNNPTLSNSSSQTSEMLLHIKDNGVGIEPEKLKNVFQPFISYNENNWTRSGIGLSLVKNLVEFLNGNISIESVVDKGTSFTIQIPLDHNPKPELIKGLEFIDNNLHLNHEIIAVSVGDIEEIGISFVQKNENANSDILIVENNKELLAFLSNHFSSFFNVSTAHDGKEALVKIHQSQPDIIISDIMMPEMDGFELCQIVKDQFETCHIPIVLLSARSEVDSKIDGLNVGADAYIDKPFHLRELELTIRNILRAKQNIKNSFIKPGDLKESKNISSLSVKDQMFLDKLNKIIYKEVENPDLSVEYLCENLFISRTLLHLKIKKITGLSSSEYIRNIKLNEAKKLLQSGMYTVSETAFKVGFSDASYFSKAFKQFFNVSPSTLAKTSE